jgi:hypothetical protein
MPSEPDHLTKAVCNETFADSLNLVGRTEAEWALTALFYAALHYVEAYLSRQFGFHSGTHESREKAINKDARLRRAYVEYAELKTLGRVARYELTSFGRQEYFQARPHLRALKAKIGY